jgi:hypothetical protein
LDWWLSVSCFWFISETWNVSLFDWICSVKVELWAASVKVASEDSFVLSPTASLFWHELSVASTSWSCWTWAPDDPEFPEDPLIHLDQLSRFLIFSPYKYKNYKGKVRKWSKTLKQN